MNALLVVDMQNDFISGGALAVPGGEEIIPLIVAMIKKKFDLVVASKDWHPQKHGSFATTHKLPVGSEIELEGIRQVLWPDHCIQGSHGAEFVAPLQRENFDEVVYKGTHSQVDSYSAFFDNGKRFSTGLDKILKEKGIERLYVLGLALDYCVKYSVLDALQLGFDTYLVRDGCRAVELQKGDGDKAVDEMKKRGAHIVSSKDIL